MLELLGLLLVSLSHGASSSLSFDLRFAETTSRPAEVIEGVFWDYGKEDIGLRLGLRLAHSGFDWTRAEYAAEFNAELLPSVWMAARLGHSNRLNDSSATTTLSGWLQINPEAPSFIRWYAALGVYYKNHRLGGNTLLPVIGASSFGESHEMLRLGAGLLFSPTSELRFLLATFEEMEVYLQNNPFIEGAWISNLKHEWTFSTYVRYQALLGFGRPDAWLIGFRIGNLRL